MDIIRISKDLSLIEGVHIANHAKGMKMRLHHKTHSQD